MICNSEILYTIQPNDTLWKIAQRFNTTVDKIINTNPFANLAILQIGQIIRICPGYPNINMEASWLSKNSLNLINLMRLLWEQHSAWTRMAIASMIFSSPDEPIVIQRLLKNPKDFANALKPYYSSDIANRFAILLTDHLLIAAELVKAAKQGNNQLALDAERRWYKNADEIVLFFSQINPYWLKEDWKKMLYEHLVLVKAEAVYLLTGEYVKGIETYDKLEIQALMMADMMADGIIKQFQIT